MGGAIGAQLLIDGAVQRRSKEVNHSSTVIGARSEGP